jgi:hypothetical protein
MTDYGANVLGVGATGEHCAAALAARRAGVAVATR